MPKRPKTKTPLTEMTRCKIDLRPQQPATLVSPIYIIVCVCVCVCVRARARVRVCVLHVDTI